MADMNVSLAFTATATEAQAAINNLLRSLDSVRAEAVRAGQGNPFAQLDASIDELSRSSTALAGHLNTVETQANQAGAALNQTGSPIDSMTGSIGRLAAAAGGIYALGAAIKSVVSTGSEFEQLGIRMTSVMGSIEAGEQATNWIKEFATETPLQLDGVTSVFLKLKNFGLDPMDGTLQKLTDTASKYGAGQEGLERISLALGQAWSKQKLQGEEIMQLVEGGVPVWDLLAKSTGKSIPELQKLSEAGKLGQDAIRGLIDAMGSDAIGASAAQMNTVNGAWSNFLDTLDQVKVAIFNSGMGDELKKQLQNITAEISKMSSDGSLARFAQQAGDMFSKVASIVGSVVSAVFSLVSAYDKLNTATGGALTKIGSFPIDSLKAGFNAVVIAIDAASVAIDKFVVGYKKVSDAVVGTKFIQEDAANSTRKASQDAADATVKAAEKTAEAMKKSAKEASDAQAKEADAAKSSYLASFETIKASGKSTADALKESLKFKIEAGDIGGSINAFATGFEAIKKAGVASAAELKEALANALKDVATKDMLAFQNGLQNAFNAGKLSAQSFGDMLKATAGEALARLGVDAQLANTGISKAFGETISLLKVLAANAQVTGNELSAAFQKSIDGAKTANEIKTVQEQIKKLSGDTRLSKDEFQKLEKAGVDAANNIAKAADKTAEAFSRMGIKSKQELAKTAEQSKADFNAILKSGSATTEGLANAFKKYATDAIAANNGVASAEIVAQAAAYGLKVAIDSTGKASLESADKAKEASGQIVAAKANEAQASNAAASAEQNKAAETEKAGEKSAEAIKKSGDAASKSMLDVTGFEASIENLLGSLQGLSKVAFKETFLKNSLGTVIDDIDLMSSSTEELNAHLRALAQNVETGTGAFTKMQNALYQANVDVVNQAINVRRLTEEYESMDGTINNALLNSGDSFDNLSKSLASSGESLDDLKKRFNLLDESQLSQLKSAIDAARQRMQAFADLVKGVRDQLDDTINALKDEQLQREGNEAQRLKNKAAADKARIDEEVAKTKGDKEAKQKGEEAKKLIDEKLAIELAALDKKSKADKEASDARKKQIDEEAKAKELANNKELEQIKKIEDAKAKASDDIAKKIDNDLPKAPTYTPPPNNQDNKASTNGSMTFTVNLNGMTEITPEIVRAKVVPVIQDIIRKTK